MEKITLPPRLELVASLVPFGSTVADIGTDHGRIPVFLVQHERVSGAIAADLNEEPLNRAKALISEHGLGQKIKIVLSDGLRQIEPCSADTIVIAGMGGETIINILSAVSWIKDGVKLILQPQSKQSELRLWLIENEFKIVNEHLVVDNDRIYSVIEVTSGISESYNLAELVVGKPEKHSSLSLFEKYTENSLLKIEKIIDGLKNSEGIDEKKKLSEYLGAVHGLQEIRRGLNHGQN